MDNIAKEKVKELNGKLSEKDKKNDIEWFTEPK